MMNYLDPAKEWRDRVSLYVGYVLIAIAVALTVLILVYVAYGFGIKNGTVIQSGLVFFSSQPNPAKISISGQNQTYTTNTRLTLPEGIYSVSMSRPGYRSWQRTITVSGGTVEHFDYPLLIPNVLAPKALSTYAGTPGLLSESNDRRWLLINQPGDLDSFDLYDLGPKVPLKTSFTLPTSLLTKASASESWQLVGWADDNDHVLLAHLYDGTSEFVIVDTQNPSQSVNLNKTLLASPSQVTLNNLKFDQYYLYDAQKQTLSSATLSTPTPTPLLSHVLAYKTYGSNAVLYITDQNAPKGKVEARLLSGGNDYVLKDLPASSSYALNLTQYSGTLYVGLGASAESKVYIYQDPIGQLASQPKHALVPSQVLRLAASYLEFSANAQFIAAENGNSFGVYDILNQRGYSYVSQHPLDAPQPHAIWMDGDRLDYVSGGSITIFDYDDTNAQTLIKASPSFTAAFNSNYHYVYTLLPATSGGQYELDQTPLLIPSDL